MASSKNSQKNINRNKKSDELISISDDEKQKDKVEFFAENVDGRNGAKKPIEAEKENYATVYDLKKAKKNSAGLTHDKVRELIKNGTLIPGNPPSNRSFKNAAWSNGMQFLYTKATTYNVETELQNWYYCSKCSWIYNGILGGGTGAVGHHYKKHLVDPPILSIANNWLH